MGVDLAPIGDNPRTLDLDTEDGQWRPARDTQIQLFPGSSPMLASIPEISGTYYRMDKKATRTFLDTQVSLAPTYVSPSGGRSVRHTFGPSVGQTFEFPKSIFSKHI